MPGIEIFEGRSTDCVMAAGQSFLVNDKEVTTIEFTVVGNWEIDSMLDLFAKMRELRKAGGL